MKPHGQTRVALNPPSSSKLIGHRQSLSHALWWRLAASRPLAIENVVSEHKHSASSPTPQEIAAVVNLFNQGRLADAEPLARAMTARFPKHGFGWNALGAIMLQQGRSAEALVSMKKAIELLPGDVDAHNNLGSGFLMQGRMGDAEASFRKTLAIDPDYAVAHNNLGSTLLEQGRLAESETSLRRALEIDPDYTDALYNLGTALTHLGRFSEAEASYQRALGIDPNYAKALVAMGIMTAGNGEFAAAEEFFQRAIAIEPEMSSAWSAIANVRKMTRDDVDWVSTAEQIAAQGLEPRQASRLYFSIGKFYDDVGDFDQAFLNYRRGNEVAMLFGERYDREKQTRLIDQICRVYDRKRMRQARQGASDSKLPLFIVGMPRSGTSLTEQIVASHSAVCGAGELNFWPEVLVNQMPAALGGEVDESLLDKLTCSCLKNLSTHSNDALRIADKMPVNFLNLGLIHTAFPRARILHTTRNPIDTCLSIYFQNFSATYHYANDLADLAHYYRQYHRLMTHWRAVLPPEIFLDVPYEALVRRQEEWSRKMIAFIGLPWEEHCLDFHQTKRRVTTASQWQVRQKMYDSSIERWRNYEKFIAPLAGLLDLPP